MQGSKDSVYSFQLCANSDGGINSPQATTGVEYNRDMTVFKDGAGAEYVALKTGRDNRAYYVKKEKTEEVNLLKWEDYFKTLKTEKTDKIWVKVTDFIRKLIISSESDYKMDIYYDGNPEWKFLKDSKEGPGIAEYKRTLVCKHPLEWDKTLYETGFDGHIKQVTAATDLWEEIKKKNLEGFAENSFWFAHPVYFINHLDRTGLLDRNAEILKRVQDEVMSLKCLEQGARGIYPESWTEENPLKPNQTYCNHAVYLTIKAVDKNFNNFTNRRGNGFPEHWTRGNGIIAENAPAEYPLNKSNYWCDILKQQAGRSGISGIVELGIEQAQEYANAGYVVIGAWKNEDPKGSPHYVTVRPGGVYTEKDGPYVAHVGAGKNEPKTAIEAYVNQTTLKEVCWYYNRNQGFIEDLSDIEGWKKKEQQ
jgi:hypothetical protein